MLESPMHLKFNDFFNLLQMNGMKNCMSPRIEYMRIEKIVNSRALATRNSWIKCERVRWQTI